MDLTCHHCGAAVSPGATACATCRQSLLIPVTSGANEPACAVHPDVRSLGTCSRCGAFACAGCLREGPGRTPFCASCHRREVATLPWDRREELGTLRAFILTAWATVSRPQPAFAHAEPGGGIGGSVLFAFLATVAGYLPTFLVYMLILATVGLLSGEMDGEATPFLVGVFGGYAVITPLLALGWTFVNAGIDHLVLRLCGVSGTFETTYRALALSMGPNIFGVIPICSIYVLPFWVLIVRVFAYMGLHKTSGGKAAAGALVSAGFCCVLWAGMVGLSSFASMAELQQASGG